METDFHWAKLLPPPQITGLTPSQNSVGKGREQHADRAGGQGGNTRPARAPHAASDSAPGTWVGQWLFTLRFMT